MGSRAFAVSTIVLTGAATALLAVGGFHAFGSAWPDSACVLAGSTLAVSAIRRAWGDQPASECARGGQPEA